MFRRINEKLLKIHFNFEFIFITLNQYLCNTIKNNCAIKDIKFKIYNLYDTINATYLKEL